MFNDSDSFFYSPTGDLTNTLQRQFSGKYNAEDPLWKRVRIFGIKFFVCFDSIIVTYWKWKTQQQTLMKPAIHRNKKYV